MSRGSRAAQLKGQRGSPAERVDQGEVEGGHWEVRARSAGDRWEIGGSTPLLGDRWGTDYPSDRKVGNLLPACD